jgi:predicted porin
MKKTLFALAALGAFAGAASAQSSVTLFGTLDVGVRYLKNGDVKQKQLATDGNANSVIGVRGVEDLGGGLKAGFWLESQVNPDTGTADASRFWQRRATVSLLGNFGEVRLGRDQTPTWTAFADGDVFGTNGVGDASRTYAVLGGVSTKDRADNMVQYFLPNTLGGFYGSAAAAAGEGTAGKKYVGGRLGWQQGPADVSVAYGQTEVLSEDFKVAVISGSYDFNVVKLYGSFQQTQYSDAKDRHFTVGAGVPVGNGTFKASYSKIDGRGSISDRDADQFAVGYVYDLSKRTALYTTYGYIKNKGSAAYTVGDIDGVTLPATGEKSQGLDIGIRHSF